MPHSVTPEGLSPAAQENEDVEMKMEDGAEENGLDGLAQHEDADVDDEEENEITMGETGIQGEAVVPTPAVDDIKQEVKLEDLFADEDSDEEFPSSSNNNLSNGQNGKLPSSPEAPASPMYGKDSPFELFYHK